MSDIQIPLDQLQKTCLYSSHVALGAKMSPFAGFMMPIQYSTIVREHLAVREHVGMFDVSHMGEIFVEGPEAEAFINHIFTNEIRGYEPGKVLYGMMCYPDGGTVDDLLVYREFEPEHFLLVVNAANIDKDFAWIQEQAKGFDCKVDNASPVWGQIAVQGPEAEKVVMEVLGYKEAADLAFYTFCDVLYKGKRLILLIAPNKERVYSEYMPYYLSVCPVKRVDRLTETIRESVGIPVLFPYEALLRAKADYTVYYRHDTHWNAMGGLVGAEELRLSLGMAPYALPADAVTEFCPPSGDLVALGGLDPDEYADDVDYRIDYRPNVTVTESPCPDAPLVRRFTASEGSDERFCLVGDSFREALVPFLSRDFKTSTFVHHDAIAAAAEDVRQADVLVLESVERYTPDLPYYVYILINLLLEE